MHTQNHVKYDNKRFSKRCHKRFSIAATVVILSSNVVITPSTHAQVPEIYKPNYKFASAWTTIEELQIKMIARRDEGQAIDTNLFKDLDKSFATMFKYLPQEPRNKVIFEKCRIGAAELSATYDPNGFDSFSNGCLVPIEEILNEIKSTGIVKTKIIANPTNGSAPVTVTFDGRGSEDSVSNTTIPDKNFFWYYTDENGVEQPIERGAVVKHTFKKEGTYKVHLTVRSARSEAGVFDGEAFTTINVGPQAANIFVSVNNKRLKEDLPIKYTSAEGSAGLRINGSATTPLGGRQIMQHEWLITANGGKEQIYRNGGKGSPGSFSLPFRANGLYTITLTVLDNENNKVFKSFDVIISDPVATIKVTPENGSTSDIYNFDGSTSYSVQSTLKTYQRTISDSEGNEILKDKSKKIQYKFSKPGTYNAILRVVDQAGNENEEITTIVVGSTAPVPQFTVEPAENRRSPSSFILDASPTYDIDTKKGNDALSYEWTFNDTENITVESRDDNNKKVQIYAKEKGKYVATLVVKDNYGKVAQVEKTIDVKSTLRPHITVTPVSTQLPGSTTFIATVNEPVMTYQWNFGDGKSARNKEAIHTYDKVGMYRVSLVVTNQEGESNEVSTLAFVGEANSPIGAYSVLGDNKSEMMPTESCTDPEGKTHPAYKISRAQPFTLDTSASVNVGGGKENLSYYIKPQGGSTSRAATLGYKFDVLGCRFIDFTIVDESANKTADSRVWFTVGNAKPTITNVVMSFPQVSDTYGIGIGQSFDKNVTDNDLTTMTVKVDAIGGADKDGSVAKYKWYYYNVQDPARLLEIKYTPANVPYMYFAMDRKPGEYRFGVEVFDNDGESTISESAVGNGPVIFFPASTENADTPLVTLKIDKANTKVGEQVRLETISSITSDRNDFVSSRIISYDFDGDGEFDVNTKDNVVTYVYKQTGTFKPRVMVTYRGRKGYAYGEDVVVEKGIKPDFLYAVVGNKLIVRDTSYGDIVSRAFCTDAIGCRTNPSSIVENQKYFQKEYAKPGKYVLDYKIQDTYGNSASKKGIIEITDTQPNNNIAIVTLPSMDEKGVINIGRQLDNKVLFYAQYGGGECFIDTDISKDSQNTGSPDQNSDIPCNQLSLYEYTEPGVGSTIARVYFINGEEKTHKDITINFLDNNLELPATSLKMYEHISAAMTMASDNYPAIKTALLQLRNAVVAGEDTSSYVLQLREIAANSGSDIDPGLKNSVDNIVLALSSETVVSSIGGNAYEKARSALLEFFPTARKAELAKVFESIDNTNGDKVAIKTNILKIFTMIDEEVKAGTIDEIDKGALESEVCNIVVHYSIDGTSCKLPEEGVTTETTENTESTTTSSGIGGVLKIVGIVLGSIAAIFIILVIIFAIKAKRKQGE